MADKEFAPLSTACARALNDRIYEKRKTAALEIEKMVINLAVSLLEAIYFGKILELAYLVDGFWIFSHLIVSLQCFIL
jgi:hypothetical protein